VYSDYRQSRSGSYLDEPDRTAELQRDSNLRAAVSLHFAHYNFVRMRRSLLVMQAMEVCVSNRLWSLDELVERVSE
jgi:hypothetical protein